MSKRLISLLLVFCMLFSLVPTTVFAVEDEQESAINLENPFRDVKENSWYYDSVQYTRVNGIFKGTSKTTFDPNGTITRGMFVTVLGRLADVDTSMYDEISMFSDVSVKEYYSPYITWASVHGITQPTDDGKFHPDEVLNRQEMASILVNYFEEFDVNYNTGANINTVPNDIGSTSTWAKDAVLKLWEQGLLNGDGFNFNPNDSVTRAQTAAIVERTDEAVSTWYKEPKVPSDRVRIDPSTGLPKVEKSEVIYQPSYPTYTWHNVIYTDGVADEALFADQSFTQEAGSVTPAFIGTPHREGYVFKGWGPAVSPTVYTDVVYTAMWEAAPAPEKYTVTYTDGVADAVVFGDQISSADKNSTTPAFSGIPQREGYTFKGWSPEVSPVVTSNVVYTAQWEESIVIPSVMRYTVMYTDGTIDEELFADYSVSVEEGDFTPVFPGVLHREGYTFRGWSPEIAPIVTSDVIYTAQWEVTIPDPVEYTVKYTDGVSGEVVFANQTTSAVENSATPAFYGSLSREGYIFKGWEPKVSATVTGDVTYVAQWEEIYVAPDAVMYTITYTDGIAEETIFTDQSFPAAEGSATPAFIGTLSREGYFFKGWSPEIASRVTSNATYTAQWEKIPDMSEMYFVSFYDGSRLIDTLPVEKDQPLGEVPSVEKSSKANAILLGYYYDPACTQPFYAENPVTNNMSVYAKYEEMESQEVLTMTSFAQMDQQPNITFEISGYGDPAQAVTLEVMDGSDPVDLIVTPSLSGYGYTVAAENGFNPGCSYQLHLSDGWTFTGKADTIRTASFSIYKEEVDNMRMNDDIVYIKDTDAINYFVGGLIYDMLKSELITDQGGSFEYSNAAAIEAGDILCIYTGTHPEQRDMDGDVLDPAFYVKTKAINGSTVTFAALGEDDFLKLYNVPDNFPIKVDALPAETAGVVNISALDAEMYTLMMGDGYDLAKAKDSIEIGDFISLLVSKDSIQSENDLYFGEITAYNAATGEIFYKKTTRDAIIESMDLYRDLEVSGDDLVTDEEKAEIEETLLMQIEESGFAEDAAFMLADIITKTDGFKNKNIESLLITDSKGNELSPEDIQLMNLGACFELTDDVELTVELIREGDQLHYKKGTQIAVGVEAEFEVELEDDEKIAIELNATFIQEVEISPRVKGYVIPYIIFFIPVPVGANVSGTVDIKSFTAFSFEAEIYTVAPEDQTLWEQFKDIAKDPRKLAELPGLPDELSKGLNTVGDVFDKIKELEDNMSKVKDKAEQYYGYLEDIETMWDYVEVNGLTTREDWAGMCDALDKTSVTSDLLEMMDMTNETELKTEYYESMEALMERYCEMVEKETDWVTLFQKDICEPEFFVYGISISVDVDFMVRADLSLAIGSNLQYEVGKRYEFWFKLAPFYKNASYSSMDLLDERFAFQFYVMGRLGLKAGIKVALQFGIGSCKLANIGVSLELGPYMKLWGFFVYEYEKYRPANTSDWHSDERMAGALLMEFGLYLKMAFEAEALSYFSYEYEFLDEEFPLLTVGDEKFYYKPNYEPAEDEIVLVKDVDSNAQNGITMTLPDYMLALDYVDMQEGFMAIDYPDYNRFHYTLSNPNFSIDPNTGLISVNVPENTRYMECDLTITFKYGKLAFSTYDMSVTVPLVWTNLSTDELGEYYTAAVRVGNDFDGYETVWSKRVLKNQEFDLPTTEEIMELIGWNEYKYNMDIGYGSQQTEGLTMIEDKVYDFIIDYDTYAITVYNVQNAYGATESRTYYADFGKSFDFSDLANTGSEYGTYTKFKDLTAPEGIDLSKAIDTRMAEKLSAGAYATANYMDNNVKATFMFTGIDNENVTVTLKKGSTPDLSIVDSIVTSSGAVITDIYPAVGTINATTTYQVVCEKIILPDATISFEENGGSEVEDITKPIESIIGTLPIPQKTGCTFAGWYIDPALNQPFELTKMPEGGAVLYAKWTSETYIVTFHVNGGNALNSADASKSVSYAQPYGTLPTPTKTGYSFAGWYTAASGGEKVTADSVYSTSGNQTLYAQWCILKQIDPSIFTFTSKTYDYKPGTSRAPEITFTAKAGETYTQGEFTLRYIAQGYEDDGYVDAPVEAGSWNVLVTRPADDTYSKFEHLYENVLQIDKITRPEVEANKKISAVNVETGYSYAKVKMGSLDQFSDSDENMQITFVTLCTDHWVTTTFMTESDDHDAVLTFTDLEPGKTYMIYVLNTDERNYKTNSFLTNLEITTKSAQSKVYFRDDTYNPGDPDIVINDDDAFYTEFVDPELDRNALLAEGFTRLEITVHFQLKEINQGNQNLRLLPCNGSAAYMVDWKFDSTPSGWTSYTRTININLDSNCIDDNCSFYAAYDAYGNGADDWYLADTCYTVTALKE